MALLSAADPATVTVKGYVLDSACAFTKDLAKPISKQCATSCANAGSPLVILADDGTIYWPIADTTPSSGQNAKLLPFAAEKVMVSGKVYQRGGSKAIVIEKIEPLKQTANANGPIPQELGDGIESPANATLGTPSFVAQARQIQLALGLKL